MRRVLTTLAFMLLLSVAARAQPAAAPPVFTPAQRAEIVRIVREALKHDPSILRDAVAALQAEEGLRQQSAARLAITEARDELLHDSRDAIAGNPAGDRTIVEFYDLRCPYCREMQPVIEQLLRRDPRVRLVLKDMPVLGPASKLGARALLAAARQGGYLRLQARLIRAGTPTEETLKTEAEALGLDWPRMQRDMADPAIQQKIEANLALARRLGVDGTPAFVIGDQLMPGQLELPELQHALATAQ